MKTIDKANNVITRLSLKEKVEVVRNSIATDDADWVRISKKAYAIYIKDAQSKRKIDETRKNVLCTSNKEINNILELNNCLVKYALALPSFARKIDFQRINSLAKNFPQSEQLIITIIEEMTLDPRIRALQNIGRIQNFKAFKEFSKIIEAATLCYYRRNYISAYLTLIPVIEGIMLRWLGYDGIGEKPAFDKLRSFFLNSYIRQPCPGNPLFYDIFCKACHKIINDHLYKPSQNGKAHKEFNRHQAVHLLSDTTFATKDNCVRLFLLLDLMTEIYWYETLCEDPRFRLTDQEINPRIDLYELITFEGTIKYPPERILLENDF